MREESETCFDNVTMTSFRVPIVFRSVWWSSKVSDPMGSKKSSKSQVVTTIIEIKCIDFLLKVCFHNGFKFDKHDFNFRFLLKGIKLNVFSEVINKYDIIFKTVMGDNRGSPHITENNFKWLKGDNSRCRER